MSTTPLPPMLEQLHFDNRFTRELPADSETGNFPRQVHGSCFSRVTPARIAEPKLIGFSREVAELLDLTGDPFVDNHFAEIFSGHRQLPAMEPYATCYGGHQFGHWAGQLGDGRAINLGEIVNQRGERWALQLKGAGRTPYSRSADGLAVLRSSLREFLCSEAMFHLGVPTTRALSLVLTGEEVVRDMFYDGNPKVEPGAVVCRVAPSFTRFGHFQIFASRNETELLQQLVDYTLRTDFPHLGKPSREAYIAWFDEVCRTTATMIVHWMRVGFVHGVMNTDNMSILGLTIDYGPYGWLEDYDPNWTPNTTDAMGRRYRFGHQPQVAMWNLAQFANALLPLIEQVEPLQESLDAFTDHYQRGWETTLAAKLGLSQFDSATDKALSDDLLSVLQLVETDMTLFFRQLATLRVDQLLDRNIDDETLMHPLLAAYYKPGQLTTSDRKAIVAWLRRYGARLERDNLPETKRRQRMNSVNPKYVLRNYLAQLAIDKAETGDLSLLSELLELLRHPYDEQPNRDEYAAKRPEWARHRAGCSMLSCSS
ncbi:MAG: YdiU family protein [Planctomycetota bacterium]|nr:YdiU family protein [Planctomycetota bacterium]